MRDKERNKDSISLVLLSQAQLALNIYNLLQCSSRSVCEGERERGRERERRREGERNKETKGGREGSEAKNKINIKI